MSAVVVVNSISQAKPIVSPASIQIHFTVLGILPDKVQIYAGGLGGEPAILKAEVKMQSPENSYTTTIKLAGGTVFLIHLCPRTSTDGMPSDKIEDQYFETFCTQLRFTTQAPPFPPPPGRPRSPVISSIEANQATLHDEANIVVGWTRLDPSDKFHFMWTDSFPPPRTEVGWDEVEIPGLSFKIHPAFIGRTYTFKVQGCQSVDIGPDNCSLFSPQSTVRIPKNTQSLREFLRLSNVRLDPGIRSLGESVFSAGIRSMMHL